MYNIILSTYLSVNLNSCKDRKFNVRDVSSNKNLSNTGVINSDQHLPTFFGAMHKGASLLLSLHQTSEIISAIILDIRN